MLAVLAAEAEACHSLAASAGVPWRQDIARTARQCAEMQGSGRELQPASEEVVDVDVDVEQDSVEVKSTESITARISRHQKRHETSFWKYRSHIHAGLRSLDTAPYSRLLALRCCLNALRPVHRCPPRIRPQVDRD